MTTKTSNAWKNVTSSDPFKKLAVAALRTAAGASSGATPRVTCVERRGNEVRGFVFVDAAALKGAPDDKGRTVAEVMTDAEVTVQA